MHGENPGRAAVAVISSIIYRMKQPLCTICITLCIISMLKFSVSQQQARPGASFLITNTFINIY